MMKLFGSVHGLFGVINRHLSEPTKEKNEKTARLVDISRQIQTGHFQKTILSYGYDSLFYDWT
jgi:hypothetical protein